MPKSIVYKVSLDTSDVSAKLQELRNSLDMAFGGGSFASTRSDIQDLSSLQANITKQPFGTTGLANLQTSLPETSKKFVETTSDLFLRGQDFTGKFMTGYQNVVDSGRLGYQKLLDDVHKAGMSYGMSNIGPDQAFIPDLRNRGTISTLGAAILGTGYSPDMAISPGAYSQASRDILTREKMVDILSFGAGMAGAGVGGALGATVVGGMLGGPIGAIAGGLISSEATDILATTYRRDLDRARFIQNTSWRFLGGEIDSNQAMVASRQINEIIQSPGVRMRGVSRPEAEQAITSYTEFGGFDAVRTAEQYTQEVAKLLGSVQQVKHILHTSLTGATQAMAQWGSIGIQDPLSFAVGLGAQSSMSGLLPSQLMAMGTQGIGMVQGTGIPLEAGFRGAINMGVNVRALQQSQQMSAETVRQFGGPEATAGWLTQRGWSSALSNMGAINEAVLSQGTTTDQLSRMTFTDKISAVGNIMGDPEAYFKFMGNRGEQIGKLGPEFFNAVTLKQYQDMYTMATGVAKIDPAAFKGFLTTEIGMKDNEAAALMAVQTRAQRVGRLYGEHGKMQKLRLDEEPGILDQIKYWADEAAFGKLRKIGNVASVGYSMVIDPLAYEVTTFWDQLEGKFTRTQGVDLTGLAELNPTLASNLFTPVPTYVEPVFTPRPAIPILGGLFTIPAGTGDLSGADMSRRAERNYMNAVDPAKKLIREKWGIGNPALNKIAKYSGYSSAEEFIIAATSKIGYWSEADSAGAAIRFGQVFDSFQESYTKKIAEDPTLGSVAKRNELANMEAYRSKMLAAGFEVFNATAVGNPLSQLVGTNRDQNLMSAFQLLTGNKAELGDVDAYATSTAARLTEIIKMSGEDQTKALMAVSEDTRLLYDVAYDYALPTQKYPTSTTISRAMATIGSGLKYTDEAGDVGVQVKKDMDKLLSEYKINSGMFKEIKDIFTIEAKAANDLRKTVEMLNSNRNQFLAPVTSDTLTAGGNG